MIDNPVVFFLNTTGVFVLIGLVLGYLILHQGKYKEAVSVLVSVIVAGFLSVVLKELFSTPRPFLVSDVAAQAGLTELSSFPSFHATLAFSAATSVSYHQRWMGILVLVAALLIGFGRIAANVHYPLDVLFGVIVGVLIASSFEKFLFPKIRI